MDAPDGHLSRGSGNEPANRGEPRAVAETPRAPHGAMDDFDPPQMTPVQVSAGAEIDSEPAAASGDERRLFSVLRHKHFAVFWTAAFGSFVGTWFEYVGVQWIVAERTRDTTWLATLGAVQLLPTLFLGLLGGIVADRVNRKKLLIVTQFAMMVLAIAFFVVVRQYGRAVSDPVAEKAAVATLLNWMLGLSLLQGIVFAFNNPAWQVMIPRLVPRDELVPAITLQGISFNAARAIGPAIAGIVLARLGGEWLFLVNAISFVGVMLAVMTTPDAPAPTKGGKLTDLSVIVADVKHAFGFMYRNKGARAALLAVVTFAVFGTPILRFLPLFVTEVYQMQEKTFGLMTGVMGVGAVIGGLAMRYIPRWYPKHHFIPLSIFLGGLSILAFSLATNVYVAGVIMAFVGVFWMWSFNSAMSALQMLVDDSLRGRVMAVCNVISLGLMPVGPYFASYAGDGVAAVVARWMPEWWYSGLIPQAGIAVYAVVLLGAGVIMVIWRTPEVDGLKPGDEGFERRPGFVRGLTAANHRPRK
ncbi:MAG: MFS transporter [Phycisphaerales bacterium]|nr:MFS transporter [Phycisphaerales bacterium]